MGQKESKSSLSKSSSSKEILDKKHKFFSIYFEEIDAEFNIKTTPKLSFDDFRMDFHKFFKIPESLNINLNTQSNQIQSNGQSNSLEQVFNEKLINSGEMPQIIVNFDKPQEFLFDLEIILLRSSSMEYVSMKSFLFFPLKFFLPQEYFKESKCKLFRHSDSLFSDPLDIEKNLSFYNINTKNFMILAYFPQPSDFLQISIYYKGNLHPKHVEKFLRIGELQDSFNKENNCYVVLCNKDSCLRIDEKTTLAQISKNNVQMIFVAEDVEDYYQSVNVASEKPVIEIVTHASSKKTKKNSIDLPD